MITSSVSANSGFSFLLIVLISSTISRILASASWSLLWLSNSICIPVWTGSSDEEESSFSESDVLKKVFTVILAGFFSKLVLSENPPFSKILLSVKK